jgi:ribonuclease Z
MLGRDKHVRLCGPPGILRQVEHRLASYSWNLIGSYPTEFTLSVSELHPDGGGLRAQFSSKRAFAREREETFLTTDGVIREEENFRIRVAFLEHSIPCLAYAFEEKRHVNFMKNRLEELGVPVGPWLSEVRAAVLRDEADHTQITVRRDTGADDTQITVRRDTVAASGPLTAPPAAGDRVFTLGELKERVLQIVSGEKIVYVTDSAFTPGNRERIVELAQGADYLFIEATFLHVDQERARDRAHLTARQAGELAREAGAARVIPFHFSPRHLRAEQELRRELREAFQGK